uniref:Uncharacterized protein n=1 Tax=Anguilla anguilla TaxID=7936 RepID=A0A0E9W3J0_ANGAN
MLMRQILHMYMSAELEALEIN